MNKLEEYRNSIAAQYGIDPYEGLEESACIAGFDAALALDLPVKFMEYSANLISSRKDGHILHLLPEVYKQDRWYTEKELYQYWIENIYKPE